MSCNDKKIAELLPWFVNGSVTEEEKEIVEHHLAHCATCRTAVNEIKQLSDQFKGENIDLLSEHILPEKLVLYAESMNALTEDDRIFIEEHLKNCVECQREIEILEKINAALKKERRRGLLWKIKNEIVEVFSVRKLVPALAYVAILLLLYPAYLGIFQKKTITEPLTPQKNYQLYQFDNRAESALSNKIVLDRETDIFSLSFTIPVLAADDIYYTAKIFDANKKAVWQKENIKSIDEFGTFLIFCSGEFFSSGEYTLQIDEKSRSKNHVLQTFVFEFTIVKE